MRIDAHLRFIYILNIHSFSKEFILSETEDIHFLTLLLCCCYCCCCCCLLPECCEQLVESEVRRGETESGDIRWWGDQGASPEAAPATWHNNDVTQRPDKKLGYIVSSFAPLVGGLIYIRKRLSLTLSRLELKSLKHWCKDRSILLIIPNKMHKTAL